MKIFAFLALVLPALTASPAPYMRLATSSGSHADITFDGTRLTVPQHCREEVCNESSQRIDRLEQALAAQSAENIALRKLVTALASRVTANEIAHKNDAQNLLDAKEAYQAADDALQQKVAQVTKMPGPKGDKGDRGESGNKGNAGEKGDQGVAGVQGPRGVQGAPGAVGAPGAKGERGIAGLDGNDGKDGAKGTKGDTGAVGAPGKDGKDGKDGVGLLDSLPGLPGELIAGKDAVNDFASIKDACPAGSSPAVCDSLASFNEIMKYTVGSGAVYMANCVLDNSQVGYYVGSRFERLSQQPSNCPVCVGNGNGGCLNGLLYPNDPLGFSNGQTKDVNGCGSCMHHRCEASRPVHTICRVHELSKPTSCAKLPKGSKSGTYTLATAVGEVKTYCDMDTDGGGWTLLANQYDTTHNCQSSAVGSFEGLAQKSAWRLSDSQINALQGTGAGVFRYEDNFGPNRHSYRGCSAAGKCTGNVYWRYDPGRNQKFISFTPGKGHGEEPGNIHVCTSEYNGGNYQWQSGCYNNGHNHNRCGYASHNGLDTYGTGNQHNGACGIYFIWCYGGRAYKDGGNGNGRGLLYVREGL